jgi:hypothetical protein
LPGRQVARKSALEAKGRRGQALSDLREEATRAAAVEVYRAAHPIVIRLPLHARKHVDLMSPRSEYAGHRLDVRSDSAATRLGRVLPRNEEYAHGPSESRFVDFGRLETHGAGP